MRLSADVVTKRVQSWFWVLFLLGVVFVLVGAWVVQWPPAITAADQQQIRINTALPAPKDNQAIEQTIFSSHDGLTEIELIIVNYADNSNPIPLDGRLTVALLDQNNQLVTEKEYFTSQTTHNQTLVVRFPPQTESAGQRYTLRLTGDSNNQLAVWGYDLSLYDQNQLSSQGLATEAKAIYYISRYQLSLPTAVQMLTRDIGRYGLLIVFLLTIIWLPGLLITDFIYDKEWDFLTYMGVTLALGLASWPILWLWFTFVGGRFSSWLLWFLFTGGWLWWGVRQRRHSFHWRDSFSWSNGGFILLLLLTFAVRFLVVRDLAFLPWVDSSRHALITAVTTNGQFLQNYEPYLPIERPLYHFGFHTIPAALLIMTPNLWSLETVLLVTMQTLSALMPVAIYSGAWLLTKQRAIAWSAAFLVALPFLFPAYYATWGRLTQISGGLIMAVLIALTWQIGRLSSQQRLWPLVAWLGAGLFLIHYRVFSFYMPFAIIVFILGCIDGIRRAGQRWWSMVFPLSAAGLVSGLLIIPQALTFWQPRVTPLLANENTPQNYNDFPTGYLTTGWEQYFWLLLGAGTLFLLWHWWRSKEHTAVLFLILWMGLLFVLTAGELLHLPVLLPQTNLNSMYISLFVPEAIVLGTIVAQIWRYMEHRHWLLDVQAYLWLGIVLALLSLFGIHQQIGILNNTTLLARVADQEAIQWLDENLPGDARIAVNSWEWLRGTWAGSDGGAWIMPLTGRYTSTPPIDYTLDGTLTKQVRTFNELAQGIDDWSSPAAAALLRGQQITHVFVGQRGGFLDPAELTANPALSLIYARDGVFIFALKGESPTNS